MLRHATACFKTPTNSSQNLALRHAAASCGMMLPLVLARMGHMAPAVAYGAFKSTSACQGVSLTACPPGANPAHSWGPRLGHNLSGRMGPDNLHPCTSMLCLIPHTPARPLALGEGVFRSVPLGHLLFGTFGRQRPPCAAWTMSPPPPPAARVRALAVHRRSVCMLQLPLSRDEIKRGALVHMSYSEEEVVPSDRRQGKRKWQGQAQVAE